MVPHRKTCAGTTFGLRQLRQVITERGEDHVVDSFRGPAYSCRDAFTRPGLTSDVGVLRTELEPAPRPAVEAVPEAGGTLDDSTCIGRAIGEAAGVETSAAVSSVWRRLSVATGVVERGRAVSNRLARDRIKAHRPAAVLGSGVGEEREFLPAPLEGAQTHQIPDQMNRTVSVDRSIRDASGAVTSDSAAAETFQTENEMRGKLPACAGADAPAVSGSVVGSHGRGHADGLSTAGGGCGHFAAGEDTVPEAVEESEGFVVSETRVESHLGDDVGRRIERVIRSAVVAVAGAG